MVNETPLPNESSVVRFARLRGELDAILDKELGQHERVAVLDAPYDANVGNHMMWVAIVDYLRQRRIKIAYAAYARTFDAAAMARAIGRAPILFLGGVTVSRLWPHHADIKRRVAQAFPHNRLFSLPATVIFEDLEDQKAAGKMFGDHPDVTLLTRDPFSGEQAKAAFSDSVRVIVAPDLGFRLEQQPRNAAAVRHDILWLTRDDLEATGYVPPADVHVFDWTHRLRQEVPAIWLPMRTARALASAPPALSSRVNWPLNKSIAWLAAHAARAALGYGNRLLDGGKVLVTDRLHPHVLAALRRQPVVLLPDRYGKNRLVYQHYTRNVEHVHWADTPDEARDLARSLVRTAST